MFKVSPVELESLISGSSILGQGSQHPPSQNACRGTATPILQHSSLAADALLSVSLEGFSPPSAVVLAGHARPVPWTFLVPLTHKLSSKLRIFVLFFPPEFFCEGRTGSSRCPGEMLNSHPSPSPHTSTYGCKVASYSFCHSSQP